MGNIDTIIRGFRDKLVEEKKERLTIQHYCHEIECFLNYLGEKKLKEIIHDDIVKYREYLQDAGYRISTINKSMSALNKFLKWAKTQTLVENEISDDLRIIQDPTQRNNKAKWLTVTQENLFVQFVKQERNEMKRARNLLLISFMLHLGLRLEEVSLIKMKDINDRALIIPNNRTIPIPELTKGYLTEWLRMRSEMNPPYSNSLSLFFTERSTTMQPRAIQFVIERYRKKLDFPLTAQILRHTYCRRLVEQKLPIQTIKKLAGHKSVQTTFMYYT